MFITVTPCLWPKLALVALVLGSHFGFAARILVEHNLVEPGVVTSPGPKIGTVAGGTPNGARDAPLSTMWHPIGGFLSVMFAGSCIAYSLWMFGLHGHEKCIRKRLEVIDDHKQDVQKAYDSFMGDTIRILNSISESAALVSERGSEGKRRHLMNIAHRLRDRPELAGSASCARTFWQFILHWLTVFRESDLQPRVKAKEGSELPTDATLERVAEYVCKRIESANASDIACQLESFMGPLTHQDVKALEDSVNRSVFPLTLGVGEYVLLRFISTLHAGLFLAFCVGVAVIGVEIMAQRWWGAVAVSCAMSCLLGDFLRYEAVDRMCRAEGEVRRLRLQSCAAQQHHKRVAAFREEVEPVTNLWLYRTTPQLEIFGELSDVLWGSSPTDASLLVEGLARMQRRLGPRSAWHGEAAMRVDQMRRVARSLYACADFIKCQQLEAKSDRLLAIIQHLETMELPTFNSEA